MTVLLLAVIYLSFISLGLPDSLLGSAWPVMYQDFSVPIPFAGIISVTITLGTVLSSLLTDVLIKRLGTGKLTLISVSLTAIALLGYGLTPSFWWLPLFAIPLGLGAGAIDAGLNAFISLHYEARHMNWLHCFWGLGASLSPVIMSFFLNREQWRGGYITVAVIQFVIVFLLILSQPLWKKMECSEEEKTEDKQIVSRKGIFAVPGVKASLLGFFAYVSMEGVISVWGTTYLVNAKMILADEAARWLSFYFWGITLGRFVTGFITLIVSSKNLIRIGYIISAIGITFLLLPLSPIWSFVGFIFIGIGHAPVFPSMLHETPKRFGTQRAQAMMGLQFASSYLGLSIMPVLVGNIISKAGMYLYPYLYVLLLFMLIISSESIAVRQKKAIRDEQLNRQ
jgi:fucose permease